MNLVIVESPAKAKTISGYLGKDYTVVASYGHIRELPSKNGSVDPENGFKMTYEIIEKSKKIVDGIVKLAKKADNVYLASDPDREGEAIAQALCDVLIDKKAAKVENIYRSTFNEITKASVTEAVKKPRRIDPALVDAQQARLSLDYLVGFQISPILWRKLPGSRSAGRVQSVALRMICDREEEIKRFVPQEYWSIAASVLTKKNEEIVAKVVNFNSKTFNNTFPNNADDAKKIKEFIKNNKNVSVLSKESKDVKQNPYPPFTTSLLQQDASRKLGFSSKKTMQIAQQLYEGVEIDGNTKGLITYMRTDGMTIGDGALKQIRSHISDKYGSDYLPKSAIAYKTKAKNAQEAHEAIRPTDVSLTPDYLKNVLSKDHLMLYTLIWKRTVACQMSPAIYAREVIEFESKLGSDVAILKASGSRLKFDGFLTLYNNEEASDDDSVDILPNVSNGDVCAVDKIEEKQHFTSPPPRFNEANLIKTLEENGIGRPSTYASIISILQDRKYVNLEKKVFHPTTLGIVVNVFLKSFFLKYVEYDFTAKLENDLDLISDNKLKRIDFLKDFWSLFSQNIKNVSEVPTQDVLSKISPLIMFFSGVEEGKKCPKCASGKLSVKMSKFGPFLGCSNYPECDFIQNLIEASASDSNSSGDNFSSGTSGVESQVWNLDGKTITLKNGKFGRYFEVVDGKNKKNASVPKNITELTDDVVLFYSSLPKKIGEFDDNPITLGIGKFGPYALCNKKFHSIKGKMLHEVSLDDVVDIIKNAKK